MPVLAALFLFVGVVVAAAGLAQRSKARGEAIAAIIEAEIAEPSGSPEVLTELMEKAGMLAERMLGRTGRSAKIQLALTRAGWSLRPGEFAAVLGVVAVLAGFVGGVVFGAPAGVAAAAGGPFAAYALLNRRGRSRVRSIEEQLPTALQLLAGSLESGSSILHAMELAAEEGDPPLSGELARVVAETRVGRPLLESLEAMASRIGSRDVDWTVEAIRIQHQTGGKLADTLRVLGEFMRARLEVRGEVRALSAEARLSAKVLIALPFVVGGYFFLFRRAYLAPLYTTSMGRALLVFAATGLTLGALWMRRLVKVEV